MTIEEVDVTIIGAGAAGLSAAGEAARMGARVVLVDDNQHPGGQYFRQPSPQNYKCKSLVSEKDRHRFAQLLKGIDTPLVRYCPGTTVWDIHDQFTIGLADGERSRRIRSAAIVISAGARDHVYPFPGWTLPGVITAGGSQNLIKGMGIAPAAPVVVAGNGPLLLVAAANLVSVGVEVAAVVEASNRPWNIVRHAAKLIHGGSNLGLAIKYLKILYKSKIPFLRGYGVIAAYGSECLSAVDVAPIIRHGKFERSQARRITAKTMVTGMGLTPSLELPRLLGLKEASMPLRGGPNIITNEKMMSSVFGVFVAGDGSSIGGVELSLVEGRIAGINAAIHAGIGASESMQLSLTRDLSAHRRLCKFRSGLERVFMNNVDWYDLLTPETIICRCEDVTWGKLHKCKEKGLITPLQLKAATRIGMGRCQGRNCLGTLAALTSHEGDDPTKEQEMPRTRPPARPILLSELLHEQLPPPELPDDPHLPRQQD